MHAKKLVGWVSPQQSQRALEATGLVVLFRPITHPPRRNLRSLTKAVFPPPADFRSAPPAIVSRKSSAALYSFSLGPVFQEGLIISAVLRLIPGPSFDGVLGLKPKKPEPVLALKAIFLVSLPSFVLRPVFSIFSPASTCSKSPFPDLVLVQRERRPHLIISKITGQCKFPCKFLEIRGIASGFPVSFSPLQNGPTRT